MTGAGETARGVPGALLAGRHDRNPCAGFRQRARDGAPDPARPSADDGHLPGQFPRRGAGFGFAHASASRSSGALREAQGRPLALRLLSPHRTVPGPSSRNRCAPLRTISAMDAAQRTGEVSCFTRSARASVPLRTGAAVTFETTGNEGSEKAIVLR